MKNLQKNIEITNLSNFKTKAFCKYFFEIKCEDNVKIMGRILDFARKENLEVLFVGGGTNMLFAFEKFNGIIIKNSFKGWNYNEKSKILEAYSGENITKISLDLDKKYKNDLWYRFIGLPGSVGGAVFGNAGCFGLEIENNLKEVLAYNFETGQIEILGKKDCDFSYRNSIFKKAEKYFIIKATFDLSEKIEKYSSEKDVILFRKKAQPIGNTCGSFFKNPKVDTENFFKKFPELCEDNVKIISAGFLIEKVGLKGFHHKTAYFSELHANFLMSEKNGNYKDLLELIEIAQKKVKEKFGVEITPEVRIIKNNINYENYIKKIKNNFLNFKWNNYEVIDHGWDHLVLIFDNSVVFRFPKDKYYESNLEKEILLLDFLKDKISVGIPNYSYVPKNFEFAGYNILSGIELKKEIFLNLDIDNKKIICEKLSNFISELHSLNKNILQKFHIENDYTDKVLIQLENKLEKNVFPILTKKEVLVVKEFLEEFKNLRKYNYSEVFIHNDLSSNHILWDNKTKKINIIDFSDRIFGDPSVDFSGLFEYGEDFVKEVYNLYKGEKDVDFLKRAKSYFKRVALYVMVDSFEGYPCKFEDGYKMFKERFFDNK